MTVQPAPQALPVLVQTMFASHRNAASWMPGSNQQSQAQGSKASNWIPWLQSRGPKTRRHASFGASHLTSCYGAFVFAEAAPAPVLAAPAPVLAAVATLPAVASPSLAVALMLVQP